MVSIVDGPLWGGKSRKDKGFCAFIGSAAPINFLRQISNVFRRRHSFLQLFMSRVAAAGCWLERQLMPKIRSTLPRRTWRPKATARSSFQPRSTT